MRNSRRVAIVVAAAFAFSSGIARATSNFPSAIKSHLALSNAPDCSLCHDGATRRGTVTSPFGASMMKRGLVAADEATLSTALDALAAEKKDSDGDGVPDVDELRSGTDPNAGGAGQEGPPEYGCLARVSRTAPEGDAFVVVALLLAAIRLRRRGEGRR